MPPVTITSDVEPVALAVMDSAEVGPSVTVSDEMLIEIDPIVLVLVAVLEFEFESLVFDPASPHAPVRSDMKLSRHALRFISW
jgi:hypothetical protein